MFILIGTNKNYIEMNVFLGEWGLPIIGHVPPKGVPFRDYLQQLKRKHGEIFA